MVKLINVHTIIVDHFTYLTTTKNERETMTKETIRQWVEDRVKDEDIHLEDVIEHGCVSGCVSSLIYYSDTVKFYDKFEDEIWDMLEEDTNQFGNDNILQTISQFNGAKNVGGLDQFKNLLAWYSVEETCRKILDEKEKEVA